MSNAWCTVEHWLHFTSGVFAITAAIAWLSAYLSKVRSEPITQQMKNAPSEIIPILDRLMGAVVKQSKLNAWAALFAALAAFFQLPQAAMPTCWSDAPWISD
jgi:hypothetical protein